MNKFSMISLSAAAMLAAACSGTVQETETAQIAETALAQVEIAPAELVLLAEGETQTVKYRKDGVDEEYIVTGIADNKVQWQSLIDECHGQSEQGYFAPVLSWNQCGDAEDEWSTGKNEITEREGTLWPLQVGNVANYSYTSTSSAGTQSDNKRECQVDSLVEVSAGGTPYDTFKVICTDKSRTRTSYYAPAINRSVIWINHHRKKATTEVSELLSVE